MHLPIYLDYMATTPIDPRVVEKMSECLQVNFGNAASNTHIYGWQAHEAITNAREQVAALVNADAREIIWTSGATEADNLAIKGAALFYQRKGKHIITCKTEHKAVLDTCQYLARNGFEISYLTPQENGLIDLQQLQDAIRADTILVSVMHVNNEIGVIQDIAAIGELLKSKGIIFHVDAAQSAGKIPIDLAKLNVDLMSFSAHKVYGPKGIGALYVRRNPRVRLEPLIHGGGHENGLRSGTLPTHQIVGMGEAFHIAQEVMTTENKCIYQLRHVLWCGLKNLKDIYLNGDYEQRVPGNLNVSFAGVDGEKLILALKDLAISSGAACTSAVSEPSHVLLALGRSDELAHSSLRFCIGRYTTQMEIDFTINYVQETVARLHAQGDIYA